MLRCYNLSCEVPDIERNERSCRLQRSHRQSALQWGLESFQKPSQPRLHSFVGETCLSAAVPPPRRGVFRTSVPRSVAGACGAHGLDPRHFHMPLGVNLVEPRGGWRPGQGVGGAKARGQRRRRGGRGSNAAKNAADVEKVYTPGNTGSGT